MCAGTLISLNTFAVLDAGNTGENQIAHIGLKKTSQKHTKKYKYVFYNFDITWLINQNFFLAL